MNLNPEQFPTYKSLFPVQTTQTTSVCRRVNCAYYPDHLYLLDYQRHRKQRGGEEEKVEEDSQDIHKANLRVNPLDVKRCGVDNLL
jgi:hypothetical protein